MEHILNIKLIREKMKHKPVGQRLYFFFQAVPNQITATEKEDLKKVLTKEHDKMIKFIDNYIPRPSKKL